MSTTRSGAFFTWDGGVTTLDAQFHWPGMAASHLIVDGGGRAAFVDVGTSHTASVLLAALRERDIAPEQVDYVLVTHIHLDHAGGAGALMRSLPNARLVVHPRGARHMVDPSRLVAGASAVYGRDDQAKALSSFTAWSPVGKRWPECRGDPRRSCGTSH